MGAAGQPQRDKYGLGPDHRMVPRAEPGHWVDARPRTWSLEPKVAEFRACPGGRGIQYRGDSVTFP